MENESTNSKTSKVTEFLKQAFYTVSILSIVIMLNFNFRPQNTLNNPSIRAAVDKTTTVVYQYGTDYYNSIGLIILCITFLMIFIGALFAFSVAIKNTSCKIEIKKGN